MKEFSTSLLLRWVGVGLHLVPVLFSVAMAFVAGLEVLRSAGRLTEAGELAAVAIGSNFAGALAFLFYRPVTLSKAIILVVELLVFAGSWIWLSLGFTVVAGAALSLALALVLHRPTER